MSLTKKDFEKLADLLGRVFYMTNPRAIDREIIIQQMTNFCAEQNGNFKPELFLNRIVECEERMIAIDKRHPETTDY